MTSLNLDYNPDAAYYGDCKDIMLAWKESKQKALFDLIYGDPPFNAKQVFAAPTSREPKAGKTTLRICACFAPVATQSKGTGTLAQLKANLRKKGLINLNKEN